MPITDLVFPKEEVVLSHRVETVTAPADIDLTHTHQDLPHLRTEDWRPWLA